MLRTTGATAAPIGDPDELVPSAYSCAGGYSSSARRTFLSSTSTISLSASWRKADEPAPRSASAPTSSSQWDTPFEQELRAAPAAGGPAAGAAAGGRPGMAPGRPISQPPQLQQQPPQQQQQQQPPQRPQQGLPAQPFGQQAQQPPARPTQGLPVAGGGPLGGAGARPPQQQQPVSQPPAGFTDLGSRPPQAMQPQSALAAARPGMQPQHPTAAGVPPQGAPGGAAATGGRPPGGGGQVAGDPRGRGDVRRLARTRSRNRNRKRELLTTSATLGSRSRSRRRAVSSTGSNRIGPSWREPNQQHQPNQCACTLPPIYLSTYRPTYESYRA